MPHTAAHAGIVRALLGPARTWFPLRAALWADLLSAMMLSLGLQIVAWLGAPTDAQGAIAFVFVPFYAAIGALGVGMAALLAAWTATAVRRRLSP